MRFIDKIFVITGCGGEMAKEMTSQILKEGGIVIGLDFQESLLADFRNSFQNEISKTAFTFFCNLTVPLQVSEVIFGILEKFGCIDVLINHAGSTCSESLAVTGAEEWNRDMEINLNGTFRITQKVLANMKKQKSGSIVTFSSVNADRAIGNPAYSVAKAGLISFSKAIAMEYGAYNIRSNVVSPGSVKTRAWEERIRKNPEILKNILKWYPLKRLASPKDISNAVLFLASDEANCISGVTLRVDGGLSAGCALFAQDITLQNFGV